MITDVEREEIINAAVERALRLLPETMDNLLTAKAMYGSMVSEFYKNNPSFEKHKEIVREIVSKVELEDPARSYEQVLQSSIPKIESAIKLKDGISMNVPEMRKLDLSYKSKPSAPFEPIGGNGEI